MDGDTFNGDARAFLERVRFAARRMIDGTMEI